MKTPEVVGSHDRRSDSRRMPRPVRRTHTGPISFGQVLQSTRRQRHGNVDEQQASTMNLTAMIDHALLSGSVTSTRQQDQISLTRGTNAQANAADQLSRQQQSALNTRVTPERAMQLIEDVTREMNGASGTRELHLELEPQHLGPIVASIVIDRGRISVRMRARQADAATALGSGADALRDRLTSLGFAEARVDVEQDETVGSRPV